MGGINIKENQIFENTPIEKEINSRPNSNEKPAELSFRDKEREDDNINNKNINQLNSLYQTTKNSNPLNTSPPEVAKTLLQTKKSLVNVGNVLNLENVVQSSETGLFNAFTPEFNKLTSPINSDNFAKDRNSNQNIFNVNSLSKQSPLVNPEEKDISAESFTDHPSTKNLNIINTNNANNPNDDFYKQKFESEKKRYESLLLEEREKFNRKEADLNKYIEELKIRQKEELKSNEQLNRLTIEGLNEDIRRLKAEVEKEIQNEKERMTVLHKSDLENQENLFKRNQENLKKFYEEQNETMKKQLQQQLEFNRLASQVELSTKQIDEILNKFNEGERKAMETEKSSLESKEKYLKDLEEKVKDKEHLVNKERESILEMRKDLDLRELEKRKENQEERTRIEKEIIRLQELQNSVKVLEFNAKEKYERERLDYIQKQADMKTEIESLRSDFNQKLNDLEYSKKIFDEEKKFFEKFKEEALKNVEYKKANLEERKKQFYEEEKEIKSRVQILQEKEFYLREKFDEFEFTKQNLENDTKKIEKDKKDLYIAAKRLEESIISFEEKSNIFQKERDEVVRKYQEIETERNMMSQEKIKIEQSKAELRLRLQSLDMLRIKYVSAGLEQQNSGSFLATHLLKQESNNPNNFKNTGTNFNNELNNVNNLRASHTSQTSKKSFNADEYISSLKTKLGESSNISYGYKTKPEYLGKENNFGSNLNLNHNHNLNLTSAYQNNVSNKKDILKDYQREYEKHINEYNIIKRDENTHENTQNDQLHQLDQLDQLDQLKSFKEEEKIKTHLKNLSERYKDESMDKEDFKDANNFIDNEKNINTTKPQIHISHNLELSKGSKNMSSNNFMKSSDITFTKAQNISSHNALSKTNSHMPKSKTIIK